MHKSTLALAVACSLRFAFNDNRQIEELQDRLTSLTESANNIQARADAEKRPLTESETQELDSIFASFEATQADIERRERLNGLNNAVSAPAARRTQAEATPDDAAAAAAAAARNQHGNPAPAPRARTAPTDRSPRVQALEDPGKWGFRTMGEFAAAVRVGSSKGGVTDPRLVANAAPSTYGTEGVGADGGFLIPPDFRTEILKKVQAEDTLLGRTDQQTSSGNSFTAPVDETTQWGSSGIQAYWENEAGQMTASKPVFTEIATKLNKLTALVPMTEELLADATSMTNYLRSKAPEKMDFKVSDAILNGTGQPRVGSGCGHGAPPEHPRHLVARLLEVPPQRRLGHQSGRRDPAPAHVVPRLDLASGADLPAARWPDLGPLRHDPRPSGRRDRVGSGAGRCG
jgi:HK97 family phage major capsid protein